VTDISIYFTIVVPWLLLSPVLENPEVDLAPVDVLSFVLEPTLYIAHPLCCVSIAMCLFAASLSRSHIPWEMRAHPSDNIWHLLHVYQFHKGRANLVPKKDDT
jgi:hypothetical protein